VGDRKKGGGRCTGGERRGGRKQYSQGGGKQEKSMRKLQAPLEVYATSYSTRIIITPEARDTREATGNKPS